MTRTMLTTLSVFLLALGCDGGASSIDAGTTGRDGGGSGGDGGSTDDGAVAVDAGDVDAFVEPDGGFEPSCEPGRGRIRIQQSCPEFIPCGGDVVGEWCYADICIEKDELLAQVLMRPEVPAGCRNPDEFEILSSSGTVTGAITFTDTMMDRMVTTVATGKFRLPADCRVGSCEGTGDTIDVLLGDAGSAMCDRFPVDGRCECEITFNSSATEANHYTLEGDTIVVTETSRRFDYCVDEMGLRMHEDPRPDAEVFEPGVQLLLPVGG